MAWVPLPLRGGGVGGAQRCPWEAEHSSPTAVAATGEGWMWLQDVLRPTAVPHRDWEVLGGERRALRHRGDRDS